MAKRQRPTAREIIERLERHWKPGALDPELGPTDHILRRWASSIGTGLPNEEWEANPKSRLPPLDDLTATKVDQIILQSPPRTAKLVRLWYKTPQPREVIARAIGVGRAQVYTHHRAALSYLRGRFHGAGIDC